MHLAFCLFHHALANANANAHVANAHVQPITSWHARYQAWRLQLLAEKGTYYPSKVSSKRGGMYFLYIAKGSLAHPQESDLHIKYAGKADKSLKERLDNHGHGMTHTPFISTVVISMLQQAYASVCAALLQLNRTMLQCCGLACISKHATNEMMLVCCWST